MFKKICATCGEKFKTRQHHQKYCSPKCRIKGNNDMQNARRAAPHLEAACVVCGKIFKQKRRIQKYCSPKCRIKGNNDMQNARRAAPHLEAACVVCGKIFKQKRRTQKYCSPECQRKQKYADWREKLGKQKPKKKTCLICGQEFTPFSSMQKYCRKCGEMYHNSAKSAEKKNNSACEPITLTCEICGKDFQTTKYGRKPKYCSDECRKLVSTQQHRTTTPNIIYGKKSRDPKRKTIDQWQAEAQQCGMSYGIYRMNIERLGKTFEELKLK